jgi:hypothetical protein
MRTCPVINLVRSLSMGTLSVNQSVADFMRSANLQGLAGCVAVVDTVHVRVRSPEKRA